MGRGGVGVGTTRSEFLAEESVNDIRYHRNGGCFVTTKRAIGFVLFAIISLIIVIVLMYYYGPNRKLEELQDEMKDIEELINKTINEEVIENIRLPPNLRPIHYRLKIHPILDEYSSDNFTFTGHVKILFNCKTETNKIILNMDDLTISDSDVKVTTTKKIKLNSDSMTHHVVKQQNIQSDLLNKTDITIKLNESDVNDISNNISYNVTIPQNEALFGSEIFKLIVSEVYRDEANFKIIIVTKNLLESNRNYTVDIDFAGKILNNLIGLYKTSYTDLSGQKKWLATTYFQSIFARRVFPCFDEPNFKSTFEISIARRTNMTVLSNMPLKETEQMSNATGWVWDHFEKSLPMSTYLVSFTICDFAKLTSESNTVGPVMNIWAAQDDLPKARYALDTSKNILIYLEKYLGIKYPLPKIDLVAIPHFARGAMGSWGILSFRKSLVLLNEDSKNWEKKQHIFISLTHELAHQWFGNLVTMKWWNDLWLNEGIGSFMAEVVQTELRPRWQTLDNFPLRIMFESFNWDSLKSTRAIQKDVTKTSQIEQIFDTVVQSKGICLIRMLNYTLTRQVFRQGLQNFLKNSSYKSTDQDSLWTSLTEIANNQSTLPEDLTVKTFMESWTTQTGYPFVTVKRNYSTGEAVVTQQIFIQDNINTDTLWYIPLSYKTLDNINKTQRTWLQKERSIMLNLTQAGNTSWVLFNLEQGGYFRMNYDLSNWNLLTNQLRKDTEKIPVANRAQLINDAFELAKLKILNYSIPLELTKYLNTKEENYVPWLSALNSLEEIRIIINNYEYTGAYENYMLNLIKSKFDSLGSIEKRNESQNDRVLRWHLHQVACRLRYEPCIEWVKKQYAIWMNQSNPDNANPISHEYRLIVQCTAIKTGGRSEWEFLWNRTLSPSIAPGDLKNAYLSLGCTHDPWLINKYLELSLNGNITLDDIQYVWESINHPVGIRTGFHFLRLNWDRIYNNYEDVYLILSAICQDFLSYLSTEIDLDDLTQFYKLHQKDLKSVAALMQASVDVIKLRISWREDHLDSVVNWLKNNH